MPTRRIRRTTVLVAALVAACTACSGDDGKDDAGTTTSAAAATTTAAGATTTIFDPSALPPMAGGEVECAEFAQYLNDLAQSAATTKSAPDDEGRVAQFRFDLPPSLQADLDTLVTVYTGITEAPTDDPGDISGKLNTPAVSEASSRLQLYLERTCTG